ncbi:MAG: JAB domain-containing protein, partial [Saprospiraceae bacterium]
MKRKAFPSKLREIKVSYSSKLPPVKDRIQVRSSKDAYEVLMANWEEDLLEYREEFKVLYLNRANHILGLNTYSVGSATGTLVCTRQILAVALKSNSSGIILSHNHPSG